MRCLPAELSDYMIDFLHNDRQSLRSCSLTCRTWYPAARYHLFQSVVLLSPQQCQGFSALLGKSPILGSFIKDMCLSKIDSSNTLVKDPDDENLEARAQDAEQMWDNLLNTLTSVQKLELLLSEIDDALHVNLTQNLPSVSQLNLQYCRFESFGDFAVLLGSFPLLQRLTIRGVSWENKQHGVTPQRWSEVPKLKSLTLGRDLDLETLVGWIVAKELQVELEHLVGSCGTEQDAIILGSLVHAAGKTLTELDLDWYSSSYSDVSLPLEFSISECTSLQTLTLRCPVSLNCRLFWIPALLAQVSVPTIRHVRFDIRLMGSLAAFDWKDMERVLLRQTFEKLENVSFNILVWNTTWSSTKMWVKEAQSYICGQLPQLGSKGLVEFAA